MNRLVEIEQEIEQSDNALIKMLIKRTRLGKELHDLLDVSRPSHPAAVRQANLYGAKMASMFDAGGVNPDGMRHCIEHLFAGLVRAQLGALKTPPAGTVPAWLEVARGRAARKERKC